MQTCTKEESKDFATYQYENELKQDFLASLNSADTANVYAKFLCKIEPLEDRRDFGLTSFSIDDIKKLLKHLKANNMNTLRVYRSTLASYLNFAVEKGVIQTNLAAELKKEDLMQLIVGEHYFSALEIRRLANLFDSAQDQVLVQLIFEGVGGHHNTEIRNLKIDDVDIENRQLSLHEVSASGLPLYRKLKVSQRTIDVILKAYQQQTLLKKGNSTWQFSHLAKGKYIVRTSRNIKIGEPTEFYQTEPVTTKLIWRRLKDIGQEYSKDGVSITPKLLQRSGMLNYASELMKQENVDKINDVILLKVADRFNMKSPDNLRSYITNENINKITQSLKVK